MDDQSESVQPDPRVNQMAGQLGKTTQSLNNLVFFARVIDLEKEALASDPPKPKAEDKHSPYPVVLVQIGGKEEKDHVRLWLPWLVKKAGADFQWWQPQTNEQVLVVAPSGNWVNGIIVGSVYRKGALGFDEEGNPRLPVTDDFIKENGAHHRTWYQDGSQFYYDPIHHEYQFSVKNKWDTEHPLLTATFKLDEKDKPLCALSLFENKESIALLSLDGSEAEKGKIEIRSGKAKDEYKIELDNNKKQIKITAGDLDKEHNLLIDNKQGKIELKIAKTTIVINKKGEVNIKSNKAFVHADKLLKLTSKKIIIDGDDVVINGKTAVTGDTAITGKTEITGDTKITGKLDVV